jgi:ketosteroid isomerase-like protein
MKENDNVALIQSVYAAFGRGDIPTILQALEANVKWTTYGPAVIPYAGTKTGPSEVVTFFQALGSTQSEQKLTIDEYIAQGDDVVTIGSYRALVKETGKWIDGAVAHLFTVRNGKITRFLDFVDTAQAADAYSR